MENEDMDFNPDELEKMFLFGEEFGREFPNFDYDPERDEEEDDVVDMEWHPRFPVDMGNPVVLTELQKERALRVCEAIGAHIDAYPEDDHAPLICITQDWRVRVDFGGWNSDSDFRDSAFCLMCKDEEGFYLSLDYVEQCVPFIEKELKEIAESCREMYGEVPYHHEADKKRTLAAEMELLSILSDDNLRSVGFHNVLIAMDAFEGSIYPIPASMDHDDYGGIIEYVPAESLVNEEGIVEVDKVKELVRNFLKPI